MFTGIITSTQKVLSEEWNGSNKILVIAKPEEWNLAIGESVAINGICSTVIREELESFAIEYMPETLRLTTAGNIAVETFVNLERSMTPTDLLSGYIVSGHVEGMGQIQNITKDGDGGSYIVTISYPENARQYFIHKGGVTVDGIALTVVEPDAETFSVAIIPHTWEHTIIQYWKVGDAVNLEYDLIAKYVERFLAVRNI